MDKYQDSLQGLLGTLTSRGLHYSGLIENFTTLILEDISTIQFEDQERQKQLTTDIKTVLESASKHRKLIEMVLEEWKQVNNDSRLDE